MKSLVFLGADGTHVELLTDLIGENDAFTVYQIKEFVDGQAQIGLSDATIAKGFNFTIDEYSVGEMKAFAEENGYTLIALETGADPEVLYTAYYYGEAIGGEFI